MNTESRRGPPPIESILPDVAGRTDTGYVLGVHMVGLRGTWHRLWAMLVLGVDGGEEGVKLVRAQMDQALGRPLEDSEFAQLEAHAKEHAVKHFPGGK